MTTDPILVAEAMGAYLDANGDVAKAVKAIGGRIAKREMQAMEKRFHWPMALDRVMRRVSAHEIDDASRRKIEALKVLHGAKARLWNAIKGEQDELGNYIIPPLQARTLEGAVQTLCQVLALERELSNEKEKHDDMKINILTFINQIGNNGSGKKQGKDAVAGLDPLDRFVS